MSVSGALGGSPQADFLKALGKEVQREKDVAGVVKGTSKAAGRTAQQDVGGGIQALGQSLGGGGQ